MKELSAADAGWIAGFIDGEGCIGLYVERDKRPGREAERLRPSIRVTNTDVTSVRELQRLAGGQLLFNIRPVQPHHKPQYAWTLRERGGILNLLTAIRPHLRIKGEQADLLCLYLRSRAKAAQGGRGRFAPPGPYDWQLAGAIKRLNTRRVAA